MSSSSSGSSSTNNPSRRLCPLPRHRPPPIAISSIRAFDDAAHASGMGPRCAPASAYGCECTVLWRAYGACEDCAGRFGGAATPERLALRDALVGLAGVPRARVVRRKLYGALTALAIRLVPGLDKEGRVGGMGGGDGGEFGWGGGPEIQLEASLRAAAPLVLQSAVLTSPPSASSTTDSDALPAALACLVAWLPNRLLPDSDVARLVPLLIALLGFLSAVSSYPASNPTSQSSQNSASSQYSQECTNEAAAAAASTALSELLARPPSAWSPAVLLEPLLVCVFPEFASLSTSGSSTLNFASSSASSSPSLADTKLHTPTLSPARNATLRRHAKLLVALAEAGVEWVAGSLVNPTSVPSSSSTACSGGATSPQSQGQGSGWGDRQSRAPGRWRGGCAPPSGSQTGLPHKAFVVVSGAQLGEGGKTGTNETRLTRPIGKSGTRNQARHMRRNRGASHAHQRLMCRA
ncbi:hypothetical protein DFH06DRAFT_1330285 [Mycena polygramma]|nr:hypothetical protein DFH06DRAFT_1330285 [Mycena polygramma]